MSMLSKEITPGSHELRQLLATSRIIKTRWIFFCAGHAGDLGNERAQKLANTVQLELRLYNRMTMKCCIICDYVSVIYIHI
jgi:hypothetical protein